jgi:Tol biopolymer transport system component
VVVLEREPEWSLVPAATPRPLIRLMRRCLEKDPSRRLRDIADARADIDDIPDTPAERVPAARSSRIVRALPWIVAGVAAALAAMVATRSSRNVPHPPPLRLSVVPPEGTIWSPFDLSGSPQFALSPDARQIVLVVADSTGIPKLWVRPLDSTQGRALAGTEHASGPFWSPDGSAIGFFADRKLKKILIQSGSVQELTEFTASLGAGSWSRDDTILLGGPGSGLLRVSAEGGPVATVTTVNAGDGELMHAWPQFLPDGRHFLFYVRKRDRAVSGTYVGSIDSHSYRLVLSSSARSIYAPPGHLLYERAGNLIAQAFDDASATLNGPAITLPDRVVTLGGPSWLPASAAADVVAYWSGDGRPTFDVNVVDRSGHSLQKVLPPGQYTGVGWSPDGSRALVTERVDPQSDTLSTIDLKTGTRVRFTLAPGVAHFGVWSPDGKQVIFSSLEDGLPRLYRKALPGNTTEVSIVPSLRQPNWFPTDWSADGQLVLYSAPGPLAWDIFALRMDDLTARPVVQFPQNQVQAKLSPNGRWLAYASDESGRFEVYVQAFIDGGGKTLVSTHGGSQPTWRRDSRELFFFSGDGTMMSVPVANETQFEHGAELALFRTRSQEMLAPFAPTYAVGADGNTFLLRSELAMDAYRTITVIANVEPNRGPR